MLSQHGSGKELESHGRTELLKQSATNRTLRNNSLRENLTKEMLQELEDTFTAAAEGNNILPSGRLALALRALGMSTSDIDENLLAGDIDFEKFLEIVLSGMQLPNWAAKEMSESYALFDRDGTGNISTRELRNVFVRLGENLLETELQDQLREFDIDGDLMVSYASARLLPSATVFTPSTPIFLSLVSSRLRSHRGPLLLFLADGRRRVLQDGWQHSRN